jgi:hypothetical protein
MLHSEYLLEIKAFPHSFQCASDTSARSPIDEPRKKLLHQQIDFQELVESALLSGGPVMPWLRRETVPKVFSAAHEQDKPYVKGLCIISTTNAVSQSLTTRPTHQLLFSDAPTLSRNTHKGIQRLTSQACLLKSI